MHGCVGGMDQILAWVAWVARVHKILAWVGWAKKGREWRGCNFAHFYYSILFIIFRVNSEKGFQ